MKSYGIIIAWLACAGLTTFVYNYDSIARTISPEPVEYCAKMQDGRMTVWFNGTILTSEVTLDNGMKIKPDATIIKKDGTTIMLKEDQCILDNGKIIDDERKEVAHHEEPVREPR